MSGKETAALSLGAQLLLEMREDIIGGRLLPGTALVEGELVKAYNASRNTIREALHQLDREGLATYVRHKGVMVRRLGLAEVRDIFQVRRTLELQAILTSRPLREYQSDRMLDALEAAELAQSREDWRALAPTACISISTSSACCAVRCSMNSSPPSPPRCACCFPSRPTRNTSSGPG